MAVITNAHVLSCGGPTDPATPRPSQDACPSGPTEPAGTNLLAELGLTPDRLFDVLDAEL
jgi:hypothetical protein